MSGSQSFKPLLCPPKHWVPLGTLNRQSLARGGRWHTDPGLVHEGMYVAFRAKVGAAPLPQPAPNPPVPSTWQALGPPSSFPPCPWPRSPFSLLSHLMKRP